MDEGRGRVAGHSYLLPKVSQRVLDPGDRKGEGRGGVAGHNYLLPEVSQRVLNSGDRKGEEQVHRIKAH